MRFGNCSHVRRCSPSGCRIRSSFNVDRSLPIPELVEIGTYDQQEVIQSYEEVTNISNICRKALQGDVSLLNRCQGVYLDSVGLPKDPTMSQRLRLDLQRYYNSLPAEIRGKYTGFEAFVAGMNEIVNAKKSEVKASESE